MKIKANLWTGIFDIVDCVVLALSWFLIIFAVVATSGYGGGGTEYFIFAIQWLGLGLNIYSLVESKNHNISITGPVLGVIGCALSSFTLILAFPSIVLLIIASVFTLLQRPSKNHTTTTV